MQQLLKKTFKTIVVLLTALPLFNCSDDTYPLERHSKINTSKKDVSFSQFKKETQQDNFALFKSITLDKQLKKRSIKNDFIIDTTKILKHVAQNNKATYSFRIYPIDKNALKPHEYYNLVYHKNGGQWEELLFKNKEALNTQSGDYRLKSSEVIYMSTPQLQSRTIISVGAGTMCETPTTTFNCTKTGSCSSGVCDLCSLCVSTSVAYEYCGSGGGGSSSEGDYGNEGGESGGGGGGLEGVYIPIPYEGEQDINNPDFLFAIEVAGFINTLPQHLNNVVLANNWMHNTIINFMKNNGGLNIDNQNKVAFALANYDSVASIPMSNLPFTTINQLHYWAFNYLLEKPNGGLSTQNQIALKYAFSNMPILFNQYNGTSYELNAINNFNFSSFQFLLLHGEFLSKLDPLTQKSILENITSLEKIEFFNEMINLAQNDSNQADTNNLINLSIRLNNSQTNLLTDEFGLSLDQYVDLDLASLPPDFGNMFALKLYFNYRSIRQLNPEYSRAKCLYYASKDIIHIGLDAFGLIPVLGEVADLTNGVLYTIEGDGVNATLSYVSAVPVAGWASVGVKYSLKVVNTAVDINTKVKLVWKVLPNGNLFFGTNDYCRKQLRKVLGMTVGNGLQAHHIIPLNKQTKSIVQKASKSGSAFHLNEALNGIPLSKAVHNGSHAHYDDLIQERFDFFNQANPNATPNQCYDFLVDLIQDIRTAIQNNPNTPINQLNF